MATHLTDTNFKEEVLNASIPVFVDFYTDWCGYCKMMEPLLENLEEEYKGKVKFAKLDAEESQKIAEQYKVQSFPTFMIFKDGKSVETILGAVPKSRLQEALK